MNLVDESNKVDNIKQEVVEEIKKYFDEYSDSNRFKSFLRWEIGNDEIIKRETFLIIRFWEYFSGCSNTHFTCGGKTWNNPENQYNDESLFYRGIRLYDVQNEICNYLEKRLIQKMRDLGFSFLRQDKRKSRFDYFEAIYYFGW